jgi:hypothetical protein
VLIPCADLNIPDIRQSVHTGVTGCLRQEIIHTGCLRQEIIHTGCLRQEIIHTGSLRQEIIHTGCLRQEIIHKGSLRQETSCYMCQLLTDLQRVRTSLPLGCQITTDA